MMSGEYNQGGAIDATLSSSAPIDAGNVFPMAGKQIMGMRSSEYRMTGL